MVRRGSGFVVVLATLAAGCDSKGASPTAEPVATAPAPPPVPPPPPEETILEKVSKQKTLAEALALSKPLMTDTKNETSPGAILLAAWAAKGMAWSDVGVPKDETSVGKIQKDADEERGKRMCVGGRIIQIKVSKTDLGKFTEGLLMSNRGDIISFANVGSSGELVERSTARTCGVVIGTYSYSNSGGGTGHAVQLVGMFDLPQNRPAAETAAK